MFYATDCEKWKFHKFWIFRLESTLNWDLSCTQCKKRTFNTKIQCSVVESANSFINILPVSVISFCNMCMVNVGAEARVKVYWHCIFMRRLIYTVQRTTTKYSTNPLSRFHVMLFTVPNPYKITTRQKFEWSKKKCFCSTTLALCSTNRFENKKKKLNRSSEQFFNCFYYGRSILY